MFSGGKRERYSVAHLFVFLFLWAFALGLVLIRPTEVPPLWFDEGWSLSVARNLIDSGIYAQLSLDQPVPATFLSTGLPGIAPIAFSFKLFGVGIWQARLPGQIFTIAAFLLLYLLTRKLFNPKIATASLFVALLMTGAHIHLHPVILGRQAIGEMPGVLFLLAGYLCMRAGWKNRPWLVLPAAIFWSLSLSIKPQILPFFLVSLALPLVVDIVGRERRRAGLTTVALVATLLAYVLWERMPGMLFPQQALTHTRMGLLLASIFDRRADTMLDITVVTSLSPHWEAFRASWTVVLPALSGIGYACWVAARRWRTGTQRMSDVQITNFAILSLTTSWLLWWMLLSIGWLRYLFPALFFSCMFTAAFLHDLTGGFSLAFVIGRLSSPIGYRRRIVWSTLLLFAIILVFVASATSLRTLNEAYRQSADHSLEQLSAFLNEETPHAAVVETFESELLFLLNRPYHYPPNELQIRLNRRTFLQEDVTIDYDPLAANPHYLVIGPMAKLWKLYDPVLNETVFRLIHQIGRYDLYARVPVADLSGAGD